MTKKSKILLAAICAILTFPLLAQAQQEMTEYPRVRLQTLDKATARTQTFNVRVGSTVKFGPLYIRPKTCKKSSPLEKPESTSFLEIWEVDSKDQAEWVFSGWMFASSPALSAMDHAIYDVWVLDCLDYDQAKEDIRTDQEQSAEPPPPKDEDYDLLED